jgi:hypothetical protein
MMYWDPDGQESLLDKRLTSLFMTYENAPLTVESVETDAVGGFRLHLRHGFAVEVFPDKSRRRRPIEHWRLLAGSNIPISS